MSDPQNFRSRSRAKQDLGESLRRVRTEFYGEHGGPELARLLGIPDRTWSNYESGITIPGEILIALLDLTGVEPRRLLRGEGAASRATPVS
jgi:transcriptional regulator with XRE-family HTH domain